LTVCHELFRIPRKFQILAALSGCEATWHTARSIACCLPQHICIHCLLRSVSRTYETHPDPSQAREYIHMHRVQIDLLQIDDGTYVLPYVD
jgi:hypothetical protein